MKYSKTSARKSKYPLGKETQLENFEVEKVYDPLDGTEDCTFCGGLGFLDDATSCHYCNGSGESDID